MRRSVWACALVVLAGCAARAPSEARVRPVRPGRRAAPSPVTTKPVVADAGCERVSVRFVDLPLDEALDQLGRLAGRNLILDPGVDERVTLSMRDAHWRTVLDVLLEWTRCDVEPVGECLRVTQPPRVTIQGCF